jgi:hypothetical protein
MNQKQFVACTAETMRSLPAIQRRPTGWRSAV